MRYSKLQIRFPAQHIASGKTILFRGKDYTLGESMAQTLGGAVPIGVLSNGHTEQFSILQEEKTVGAAWFYSYQAMEGRCWTILDDVELYPGCEN